MTRGAWFLWAGVLVAAFCGYALAQSVEGLDLGAITRRAEVDAVDQEAFVQRVATQSEALREEARDVAAQSHVSAGHQLKNVKLGRDGVIDFDSMIEAAGESQKELGAAPRLIVFASLAMPEQSLKALIHDTAKAGGVVVFRGFPGNSMRAFQQGLVKVVADKGDYGNIGIDPRLFAAFKVDAVPVMVAVSSDFDLCDGFNCETQLPAYDRMSGNVTLRYALVSFAEGKGPGAGTAAVALRQFDGAGQ